MKSVVFLMVTAMVEQSIVEGYMLKSVGVLTPNRNRVVNVKSSSIDLDSPEVAREFDKVKELQLATVKKELDELGIPYDSMMSEMDVKLRLMEARVRLNAPAKKERKAPAAGAGKYERLIYEKPAVKKFVDNLMEIGDINAANAFTEYIENEKVAKQRYGNSQIYLDIFAKAEELMNAPAFTSPKLEFNGFPSAMGEDMIKISLEEFGTLKSFSLQLDESSPECAGTVEFESQDAADSAVAKWDGADMGMGSKLSLKYIE